MLNQLKYTLHSFHNPLASGQYVVEVSLVFYYVSYIFLMKSSAYIIYKCDFVYKITIVTFHTYVILLVIQSVLHGSF